VDLENLPADDLIRLCLQGPASNAWPEFVRRFNPAISCAVASRLGGWKSASREDVEELVQQLYLRLCENDFGRLRRLLTISTPAIVPYLRAAAVNLATDHLRKKETLSGGGGKPTVSLDGLDRSCPDHTDRKVFLSEVHRYLERCAPTDLRRSRAVFWLYYRVGLTANEIAKIAAFHLEVKGVESLLHRLADCVRRIIVEGYSRRSPSLKKENVVGERSQ